MFDILCLTFHVWHFMFGIDILCLDEISYFFQLRFYYYTITMMTIS